MYRSAQTAYRLLETERSNFMQWHGDRVRDIEQLQAQLSEERAQATALARAKERAEALAAERDALVRDFVGQLDTGERAVPRLTFEAGESQAAAAGVLGLSRDQVYRTMVRIRTAALRFFRERGHLDDA
jgi:DNA-directed RNA polymerase specialized sigma subunit